MNIAASGKAPCKSAQVLVGRIEKIIKTIPDDFPQKSFVVEILKRRRTPINLNEPHTMSVRWEEIKRVIDAHLPPPQEAVWVASIKSDFDNDFKIYSLRV